MTTLTDNLVELMRLVLGEMSDGAHNPGTRPFCDQQPGAASELIAAYFQMMDAHKAMYAAMEENPGHPWPEDVGRFNDNQARHRRALDVFEGFTQLMIEEWNRLEDLEQGR